MALNLNRNGTRVQYEEGEQTYAQRQLASFGIHVTPGVSSVRTAPAKPRDTRNLDRFQRAFTPRSA